MMANISDPRRQLGKTACVAPTKLPGAYMPTSGRDNPITGPHFAFPFASPESCRPMVEIKLLHGDRSFAGWEYTRWFSLSTAGTPSLDLFLTCVTVPPQPPPKPAPPPLPPAPPPPPLPPGVSACTSFTVAGCLNATACGLYAAVPGVSCNGCRPSEWFRSSISLVCLNL